jgi:Fe-S cluster assembly protein SufD
MAGLPNSSNALQQWHHLFEAQGERRTPEARQHLQQMLRLGLPTRKHEDWKYTPLDALNKGLCRAAAGTLTATERDRWRCRWTPGGWCLSTGSLARPERQPGRQRLRVSVATIVRLPDAVQPEVFLHLTESLAQTVTHIRVKRNQRPAKPLLLMHITRGLAGDEINTAHYRHHLELESGAEATIIEHYLSLNEQRHFTGARLTMTVADNAQLQHIKLAFENAQSYHFAHNDLCWAATPAFSSSFLLGGAVLRHTPARSCGEQHPADQPWRCRSTMRSATAHLARSSVGYCNSRQLHKTIVSDKGRAVFNGLINVAQHAIKTDGQMTNNNLLLGRLAEVDTKPQLEIYADDVKCSHGATIGRIDDEQLFYLRSRGITSRRRSR